MNDHLNHLGHEGAPGTFRLVAVDETNPNAAIDYDAVAELIAASRNLPDYLEGYLAWQRHQGDDPVGLDIAETDIERFRSALARVGGAPSAAVAELIAAAADIIRVERSQGITDEEADVAVERLDLALVPFSGRVQA